MCVHACVCVCVFVCDYHHHRDDYVISDCHLVAGMHHPQRGFLSVLTCWGIYGSWTTSQVVCCLFICLLLCISVPTISLEFNFCLSLSSIMERWWMVEESCLE